MEASKNSILIIDSSPQNIEQLETMLVEKGYEIEVVRTGKEILEREEKRLPHLILLNTALPGMDGYELCRILKSDTPLRNIPLIFIVEELKHFDRAEAFQLGAVDYIVKPFEKSELFARIRTHLELNNHRTKLLEENRQLRNKFDSTFQQLSVGVTYATPTGRLLRANRCFCEMLGYEENELLNGSIIEAIHPDDRESENSALRRLLKGEIDSYTNEARIICKSGKYRWFQISGTLVRKADGSPDYFIGVGIDIGRRKEAEENYRVLTERFTLATRAAGIGVWELDVKSSRIIWDDMMYSLYGFSREDYPDPYLGWHAVVHPDDKELVDMEGILALRGEKSYNTTFRIIWPDKSIRHIRAMATLYRNSDDEPISMIGVNWDISESKMLDYVNQTMLELSRKASRLSCDELVQSTIDKAVEITSSSLGFFHFINPDQTSLSLQAWSTGTRSLCSVSHIEKGCNYTLEEAGIWVDSIRQKSHIIINDYPRCPTKRGLPEGHVPLQKFMCLPIMSGDRFVAIIGVGNKKTDYSDFDLKLLGLLAKNSWNIIKRKQSEEEILSLNEELEDRVKSRTVQLEEAIRELRESEEGLRIFSQALQYNPASVVITDPSGTIEYVNPKFCRVTGFSEVEVVGENPRILQSGKHSAEFYQELWHEIRAGHEWRGEIINRKKSGVFFWEAVSISPIFDSEGEIIHFVGIKEDITQRKQMEQELKLAKEAAEAATRAKSDFLANMSHEIRTPMNAIVSLNYLLSQTELTAKQEGYVGKMKNSARGLLGIINDILDFSKIEAGKLEVENIEFELKEVIANLGNMLSHKAQERGLKLSFEAGTNIPLKLIGDPLRLGQVLLNLTGNALKFTKRGEIRVGCSLVRQEGDKVTLKFMVSDTGIGMSEEQQGKLFSPFSQADTSITRKYGGTGLGLSISRGIVKSLGGRIWVNSNPGEGSTFYFTIDCRVDEESRGRKNVMPHELERLRVMIVDDDENNLIILQSFLKNFSLESKTFKKGEDALAELVRANHSAEEAYRLLLLDWKMPGMSGSEVMKRLKRIEGIIKPKIIVVTGYNREQIIMETELAGVDGFLFKPISRSMLFDVIIQTMVSRKEIKPSQKSRENAGRLEARGLKILLVEDNEINQQVAVEILEQRGVVVDVAENGEDALILLAHGSYDLVLMDLQMPIMDGFKATEEIRKQEKFAELPIIAMTADAMAGIESAALAVGMNDYITKPIDPYKLFEKICRWGGITEASAYLPRIEHIAVEEGVLRLGGNVERYLKVVLKFKENNLKTVELIKEFLDKRDYSEARELVHAVKGGSGNIGAKELFRAATELDICLKERGESDKVEVKFNRFSAIFRKLITAIEAFEESSKSTEEELVEGAGELSREELELVRPKLEEFKGLLSSNNIRSIKLFTALTGELGAGELRNGLLELEGLLDNYNFSEALGRLEELMKNYY